ncbi:MAG: hypothetical protein M3R55_08200 [Acidobacteriota bacterium]|nr:hypothetical protein [Acidobacteriota bacterium]
MLVVLAVGLSVACAPSRTAAPVPAPAAQGAAPPLANDLKWVRDSAEYHAAVLQTYRVAGERVAEQAASRAQGAWAVVLDADETVISNLTYQIERGRQGLPYSQESWTPWTQRRAATPLPGAATFLARVRELGGRIAIVTNRLGVECPDTEAVFRTHQLVYDVMLCRLPGMPSDKNARFDVVARGEAFGLTAPIEVIAFVGDNIHDFPRLSQATRKQGDAAFVDFGARFFLVPNPMYGGWQ